MTVSTRPASPRSDRTGRAGRLYLRAVAALCLLVSLFLSGAAVAQTSQPRTVNFPSADGKTMLVGYLFAPVGHPNTAPAVVLLHGRSGAYSSWARGNYSSVTLDKRLRNWAQLWSEQGYWALIVDSFGPRGYPAGFAEGTDDGRPAAVNEVLVRPLDAYGALRYLRTSPRVKPDRIALQGWANGGSATLVSMNQQPPAISEAEASHGFKAAIAVYPGCTLQGHFKDGYEPYAPVHIFIGTRDDEAPAAACEKLVSANRADGHDLGITLFEGATHDFDDPGRERPQMPANVQAAIETRKQAEALFAAALR